MEAPPGPSPTGHLVHLVVGGQDVSADLSPGRTSTLALKEAIGAANRRAHVEGLPDALNPDVIDVAKATAFVDGLPHQRPETVALIAGHWLSLLSPGLGLSAAAPTRPESFAAGFTLLVDEVRGRNVFARTSVSADPALAQDSSLKAQAAVEAAEASVRDAEAGRDAAKIGAARRLRATVAWAWRLNARAWADAMPGDRAAHRALAAAQTAARAYDMPRGGLAN